MSCVIDASSKPLPIVLRAVRDELLSSWRSRHARFYGVTGPFFAKWLGLGDIRLSTLDHRLSLELTEKFRCDPVTLISMTQINTRDGQVCNLISRGKLPQICYPCVLRYTREGAVGAVSKHWSKAWRITCPACRLPFTDTNEHRGSRATLLETSPFEDLWLEALVGEQIVENHVVDEKAAEHSPVAVLRLLLVQTWKPITGALEHPVVGWVLGTLFPNFDVRARPIKRRVTHTAIASRSIAGSVATRASPATSRTTKGQCPPSSSDKRFSVSDATRIIDWPAAVEAVAVIIRTSECAANAAPASGPEPGRSFSTPFGRPASAKHCRTSAIARGVSGGDLTTMVQPAANAGPTFHA
jgi:hypothetical protein